MDRCKPSNWHALIDQRQSQRNASRILCIIGGLVALLALTGCVATKPYDYTNYRLHPPRSILVLPPLNESTDVKGTYSYLSTVTKPIAEHGYYVFPVAVVDQFLKENGMPSAGEMHQVPLNKVMEVVGADAVLFITLKRYGTKYEVVNSATVVEVHARLVDTRTGLLLWDGTGTARYDSSDSDDNPDDGGFLDGLINGLIDATVDQIFNTATDAAHDMCPEANRILLEKDHRRLPYGPYHPKYCQRALKTSQRWADENQPL